MSDPCPRCDSVRPTNRLGVGWCCAELRRLRDLMGRPVPATMRELTHGHFIGRSEKSIDAACRRWGFKVPVRAARVRRCRCLACGALYAGGSWKCCERCRRPEAEAAGEGATL